jgi:hypothetical protein
VRNEKNRCQVHANGREGRGEVGNLDLEAAGKPRGASGWWEGFVPEVEKWMAEMG